MRVCVSGGNDVLIPQSMKRLVCCDQAAAHDHLLLKLAREVGKPAWLEDA